MVTARTFLLSFLAHTFRRYEKKANDKTRTTETRPSKSPTFATTCGEANISSNQKVGTTTGGETKIFGCGATIGRVAGISAMAIPIPVWARVTKVVTFDTTSP